jgi:hypothetical protein
MAPRSSRKGSPASSTTTNGPGIAFRFLATTTLAHSGASLPRSGSDIVAGRLSETPAKTLARLHSLSRLVGRIHRARVLPSAPIEFGADRSLSCQVIPGTARRAPYVASSNLLAAMGSRPLPGSRKRTTIEAAEASQLGSSFGKTRATTLPGRHRPYARDAEVLPPTRPIRCAQALHSPAALPTAADGTY